MTRQRRASAPHRVSIDDLDGPDCIDPKVAHRFLTQRAGPPAVEQIREVLARVRPIHHAWLLSALERANRARRRRRNTARYYQHELPLDGGGSP